MIDDHAIDSRATLALAIPEKAPDGRARGKFIQAGISIAAPASDSKVFFETTRFWRCLRLLEMPQHRFENAVGRAAAHDSEKAAQNLGRSKHPK